MDTSQFMDKQIMDLSGSQKGDFFEFMNAQDNHSLKENDDFLPSYDFHPIRPTESPSIRDSLSKPLNSADEKSNSSSAFKSNHGSVETFESAKYTTEKDRGVYDAATVAEIDRTLRKHTDNVLHALETVSARLSHLETRTHHLESSVEDLKVSVGNNNGSIDGKLRQLENLLREVQPAVEVLREKQEIAKAQLQLVKLPGVSKADQVAEQPSPSQADSVQKSASLPQHSLQPHPTPAALQQTSVPPSAPLPPPVQNPPPAPLPTQMPLTHQPPNPSIPREQYYPPPGPPHEPAHPQYQMPPVQQPQPTPQQYQAPLHGAQYTQPGQAPQQLQSIPSPTNPPQLQPPLNHHSEETSYGPPPSAYPSSICPPSLMTQPPSGPPPTQQFYGPNTQLYETAGIRPSLGQMPVPSGYGPPPGSNFNESYSYSGPPSHYSSPMKPPPQHLPSPTSGSYPRLPTAQILPHALPTATNVSSGSNSGASGNRVPIDDVVEKVATMGFSKDQVRATVRKLTENGQSVDLNVVLDKLMNDGEIQPQKGWFGP